MAALKRYDRILELAFSKNPALSENALAELVQKIAQGEKIFIDDAASKSERPSLAKETPPVCTTYLVRKNLEATPSKSH